MKPCFPLSSPVPTNQRMGMPTETMKMRVSNPSTLSSPLNLQIPPLAAKTKRPDEEKKTIFVGNLPVNTKEKQLKRHFESFGTVKSVRLRSQMGKIIYKKSMITKDPCITAFVVFDEQQAAEAAVENCDKKFKERMIRVTLAGQKKGINRKTIFVGNLAYATVDDDLYEVFSTCGELESVRTIRGPSGCKGIAYVTFKEKSALALALELQGTRIRDRPIRIEKCRDVEKAAKKSAKKEDDKNTKVVHKFVNGKHVPITQKVAPPTPTNAGNALKRLQKKPGFNSDKFPQKSGPGGGFKGPGGRPRPGVRGAGGKEGGPHNAGRDGKGPRKPGYKPKAPKQKGLPKNIQMAKKLNVNWKKPTWQKKKEAGGAGASKPVAAK